ncbi:MAG TPA: Phenylacetic acid catabolic protein [Longimicrobiales bacterium]
MSDVAESTMITRAADLPADLREYVHDLILVLADTKRLLGMRYAEWILGAPELEAGIACASMSQDEWGHGRLLYALLKDFGDDVDAIEHGREPSAYRSMQALDRAPVSWPELVALNALADTALSNQLEALTASTYVPLRQRVQKILDEEQFHTAHGRAWFTRLARAGDDTRAELAAAVSRYIPDVLAWFGNESDAARAFRNASIVDAAASDLRARYLQSIAPLLADVGAGDAVTSIEPDWNGFDESTRRYAGSAPDEETIRRIRGDKNRAFLMD